MSGNDLFSKLKSDEKMNKVDKCGLCHKLLNNEFAIQCQNPDCKSWHHGQCVNIPIDMEIRFISVLGQINWTCPGNYARWPGSRIRNSISYHNLFSLVRAQ